MGFTHVQGNNNFIATGSNTTISVVLTTNPLTGSVVCVFMEFGNLFNSSTPNVVNIVVKDSNNNVFTVSPNSPARDADTGVVAFYLIAPANATKTITATWTITNPTEVTIFADEFSLSSGVAIFDKDVISSTGGPGTTINTPSITPLQAGELLYAGATTAGTGITAPANGATLGVWTGGGGGINAGSGADVEYVLSSASGATAVNFTQGNGTWCSIAMAFQLIADTIVESLQMQLS